MIGVRFQADALTRLDAWIAAHDPQPTRPEAIRRLIEAGLQAQPAPAKPARKKAKA
jgi:hypothetical protein